MTLFDSHCHLADERFGADTAAVIERAAAAGVTRMLSVGAIGGIETDRRTVEIAERNAGVFAAIGVHPHDARDASPERLSELRELARCDKVVAIGETGLDFHYQHSPPAAQEASLEAHLQLAREQELPVVIHCRSAERRLAEILRAAGMPERGGVIHCFTGDLEAARAFIDLGCHLSYSGIVTFKNAGVLRETVSFVPGDRLLVETDAPYLAPEPYRGRLNEPAYVASTVKVVAALRGVSPEDLAELTACNADRLFGLGATAASTAA